LQAALQEKKNSMPDKLTTALVATYLYSRVTLWLKAGGATGGGLPPSGSLGGSGSNGAAGSPSVGNINSVTRENGVKDNNAVPRLPPPAARQAPPSYGQSPAGAAATKSLSSTDTGVMVHPH
jgi:hypothetical protein